MNRETKFRAYIKNIKDSVSYQEQMPLVSVLYENGDVMVHCGKADMQYYCADEIILLQYTGLKDKNGVEIYEGDIIIKYCWYEMIQAYVVVYVGHGFQLVYFNDIYDNDNPVDILDNPGGLIEVIGNIYEHPELADEGNE